MFLDEISRVKVEELLIFLEQNRVLVISDVIKGRGFLSAEWMLVALNHNQVTQWTFKSINEVINHYSKGVVTLTQHGSLKIGGLTAQRKGGDGGRDSAKCLQFKFNPLELLDMNPNKPLQDPENYILAEQVEVYKQGEGKFNWWVLIIIVALIFALLYFIGVT